MDTSLVKPNEPGDNMANLAALMDVHLAVSIRFGETEMLLEDVI